MVREDDAKGSHSVPGRYQGKRVACSRNRNKADGAKLKGKLVGGETGVNRSHQVMQTRGALTKECGFFIQNVTAALMGY